MSIQLKVGGHWLTTLGGWGELTYSSAADGGCLEAAWKMDLPLTYSHPALRRGQTVEVKVGPANVWSGVLVEVDAAEDWTMNAKGLATLGRNDFLCFDAALNTTSTPDVAIDQAIARGLRWTRPTSLSNAAFAATGTTDSLNKLGDLLDAWATSVSKRWGVDENGAVYASIDPTVPTWHLSPNSGRLGLADDEYASDVFIRYVATGAGYATATVADTVAREAWGRREFPVDATGRGLLTAGQATAVGTGLFAKGQARQAYTNGLNVSKYQLTTPGGTPACLPFVKGGQLVRLFGVLNDQGQPTGYVDWVIGEAKYEAGADTIELAPVELAARNYADVVALAVAG